MAQHTYRVWIGERTEPAGFVTSEDTETHHAWELVGEQARILGVQQTVFNDDCHVTYDHIHLEESKDEFITLQPVFWVRPEDPEDYFKAEKKLQEQEDREYWAANGQPEEYWT